MSDIKELMTPDGRFYMRDGIVLPSITTVLKHTGDKDFLVRWRKRVGDAEADRISLEARERGTALHAFAEAYLKGEKSIADIPSSDPHILFYDKLQKWLHDNIDGWVMMETPLHSPRLRVAGRVDLVANHKAHGVSTIDYKGTTLTPKLDKWITDYHVQVCAYSLMLREHHKIRIDSNVIVVLNGLFVQTSVKKPADYVTSLLNRIEEFYRVSGHMVPSAESF